MIKHTALGDFLGFSKVEERDNLLSYNATLLYYKDMFFMIQRAYQYNDHNCLIVNHRLHRYTEVSYL